jgi:hypothetical protein
LPLDTPIPVLATIGAGTAVIHPKYGRGTVRNIDPTCGTASVLFTRDAGIPRRVSLCHLRPGADAPPVLRIVYPLDRAGEAVAS